MCDNFRADTPLVVTGAGCSHWIAAMDGELRHERMLTVFLLPAMATSGVIPMSVREGRLFGKAADFLRRFRALYLGSRSICIIMGWANWRG